MKELRVGMQVVVTCRNKLRTRRRVALNEIVKQNLRPP